MKIWVLLVLLNGQYMKVAEYDTQQECIYKQEEITKQYRKVSLCFSNYKVQEVKDYEGE
jgi:hypothetical protein